MATSSAGKIKTNLGQNKDSRHIIPGDRGDISFNASVDVWSSPECNSGDFK